MRVRSPLPGPLPIALVLVLSLSVSTLPTARAEASSEMAAFTVNSAADRNGGICDAVECTLREAIFAANAQPNPDTIGFAIPGAGPHTIQPIAPLPAITSPVTLDGTTQPGFAGRPIIELNGALAGDDANGLEITAGESAVRGLVINRFEASGIVLDSEGGNVLEGNFIGTGLSGTTDQGNGTQGILIVGESSENRIGGLTPEARNLISGNDRSGVYILGAEATNNLLLGNFIGTDLAGTNDLGNTTQGILISEASGTVIGGSAPGAGNVISGNDKHGVFINGMSAEGSHLLGNHIGTDATGTHALRNRASGLYIVDAPSQTIGGTTEGAGNLISGNLNDGIEIVGTNATDIRIEGNHIGTNAAGTAALSNLEHGIVITFAARNTIGGTEPMAGNLISGNDGAGIFLEGSNAAENRVLGNHIGTDVTGTAALGNQTGIAIEGALTTTIGGLAPGTRNLISGNREDGIAINGNGSLVRGNFIGTDAAGAVAVPNGRSGITICVGFDNVIGGATAAARNVVSGNAEDGIAIFSCGFTPGRNQIMGNFIGTDAAGTSPLGNARDGLSIDETGHDNLLGGPTAEQGNTIAFNGRNGLFILAPQESETTTSNAVLSNRIFANGALGIDLAPRGVNPNDSDSTNTGANRLQNFPVITAATSGSSSTLIEGVLNSLPSTTFHVQLFSNAACNPSGYGEGEQLVATHTVTTNRGGAASFVVSLPAAQPEGTSITATATDPDNNTSEFSACALVVVPSAIAHGSFAAGAASGVNRLLPLALLTMLGGVLGALRWRRQNA